MEELLKKIRESVREYDPSLSRRLVEEAIAKDIPPLEIVNEISGELKLIGDEYEAGELFLTDLIGAATAVEEAMEPIREEMESANEQLEFKGVIVIGTVEGDIHTIGKNIVTSMLRANGYNVIDIGADQPVSEFIRSVKEHNADVVGASALLRTTMMQQRNLIEALEEEGLRREVKAIIGGAPVTKEWCEEIGADGYSREAVDAVRLVERLLNL